MYSLIIFISGPKVESDYDKKVEQLINMGFDEVRVIETTIAHLKRVILKKLISCLKCLIPMSRFFDHILMIN